MAKPHSESFAWREVARLARKARSGDHPIATTEAIIRIADAMLHQVQQGIHANPALVVFGNPGRGKRRVSGKKFSGNVLAVIYVHDEDGERYIHGFDDARLDLKTMRDGTVQISGLADESDVAMVALDDGSVLLRGEHGQRLWDRFE